MKNNLDELKNLFEWPTIKPEIKNTNVVVYNDATNMVYVKSDLPIEGRIPTNGISQPMLHYLLNKETPKVVLEVGSWMGNNTTAFILQNTSDAHLICVDHWSEDFQDYVQHAVTPIEALEKLDVDLNGNVREIVRVVWDSFLINGWSNRHRLTPIRKKSREALPLLSTLNIPVDFIYIDANHNYEEALYDIKTCCEIWPDAVICGDDLYWPDGGVKKAVEECALLFNRIAHDWNGTWYFSKK